LTLRIHPDEIVATSDSPLLALAKGWERTRLSEVAEIISGFAFKSAQFVPLERGGMPLIRIRDVGREGTETGYTGEYEERYVVNPGDLLVGMDGDFRVARWTGPQALLNQRVCKIVLRDEDRYDERFLLYVLPGYLDEVHRHTSSVTVKHLSSRTLLELPLPVPPLDQQRAIVAAIEALFSRRDAGVESLERVRRNLKRMNASVVHLATSGKLVPREGGAVDLTALLEAVDRARRASPRARRADVQRPNSPPRGLPVGWAWTTVGAVASRLDYGSSVRASTDAEDGVAMLRMGNIKGGRLDLQDLKYMPADHPDATKMRLAPGDVLFSRTNSPALVGKTACYMGDPDPAAFASYLIRVRFVEGVDPRWASMYMNSDAGRAYISQVRVQQVGQANVSGAKLAQMPLAVPPLEEQSKILEEVDRLVVVLDRLGSSVDRAERQARRLRQTILGLALSGGLTR
jgi:type I restriction enzyme, S subunit